MVAWLPLLLFSVYARFSFKDGRFIFPGIFRLLRPARVDGIVSPGRCRRFLKTGPVLALCIFLAVPGTVALSAPRIVTFTDNTALGTASWYSEDDTGILPTTANMERFDDSRLTCALWGVPFNTLIRVTNIANGKAVIVRVNDRGPARRLVRQGRIIDLTKEAFSRIGDLKTGIIRVKITILSRSF